MPSIFSPRSVGGIFLEATRTETFERRYWETLRRLRLASAIGETALSTDMPAGFEKRKRDELVSGLSEAIDGVVRSDTSFEVSNGMIVAEDGQSLQSISHSGLQHAIRVASNDNFYANFYPQRARHELDTIREIDNIVSGNANYNAMIIFSPYTEELAGNPKSNAKLRHANQKPDWERGMIQIVRWDGQYGHIAVRSIDNSSVELFKEVAKNMVGYEFQATNSTEMVGERIYLNLDSSDIADDLVDEADSILSAKRGGIWVQGRQEKTANTQKYVESQTAIVDEFMRADEKLAHSHSDFDSYQKAFHRLLYDYSALLEGDMLSSKSDRSIDNIALAASASGAIARAEGKVYDMCGLVLTADGEGTNNVSRTGFESLQRLIGKKIECPACKEEVVVPGDKLMKGVLCCSECKFEVDACTGSVINKSQPKKPISLQTRPKKETDWQRIVREDEEKKFKRKLDRQQAEELKKAA